LLTRLGPRVELQEARRGWFHLTLEASDVLHEHFPATLPNRKRLTSSTAHAVYRAFAEAANEAVRKRQASSPDCTFTAYRSDIARYAGVTVRTLGPYVDELVKIGVLDRQRRSSGRRHQANVWRLPLHARGDLRGATSDTPSDLDGQPATPLTAARGATSDTPLNNNVTEDNVVDFPSVRHDRQARRESASELLSEIWGSR
jgi:hypothetical protein